MAKAEIVQLEVPLVQYNEGAPTLQEIIAFMAERNFAVYDVTGFVRPFGGHLVQVDLLFVRSSSKLRPDRFAFRNSQP